MLVCCTLSSAVPWLLIQTTMTQILATPIISLAHPMPCILQGRSWDHSCRTIFIMTSWKASVRWLMALISWHGPNMYWLWKGRVFYNVYVIFSWHSQRTQELSCQPNSLCLITQLWFLSFQPTELRKKYLNGKFHCILNLFINILYLFQELEFKSHGLAALAINVNRLVEAHRLQPWL